MTVKPPSTRHRWGEKVRFALANKSERACTRCDMVKVGRREAEGARDIYWTELWRDGDRINCEGTPPCDARLEAANAAA